MASNNKRKRYQKPNFGLGRTIMFAVAVVLNLYYGGGHYKTRAAHVSRFRKFFKFLKQHGINDVRNVGVEHAEAYAQHLTSLLDAGHISLSYAHNLVSSFNVVMQAFRRDEAIKITASDYFASRSYVRKKTPDMNDASINEAIEIMEARSERRAVALLKLIRFFGLRLREGILADLDRWWNEYQKTGFVNVIDGTKGGRKSPDRLIRVTPEGKEALEYAISVRAKESKNLLATNESLIGFVNTVVKRMRNFLKEYGIVNIREVRTYFMVELFEAVTGLRAPVRDKSTLENEKLLRQGYEAVAQAAGHDRIGIARAYVG
ncbi:integrase domain-containing protein [Marinobacterium sediminicola]|uniref:Integrase n=1 Tax=Marinobacterium sediminicola TaxID=518898 RepID=A0ABY1S3J0_9GAMM|nr:integrase domain-containing protein [Marinobacterium sediminicola]ULG68810.1 integrase domain-containing protein [Marinobacterium sediminicola]SMR77585.1 Integrase [Marinobacterium sediminicola]